MWWKAIGKLEMRKENHFDSGRCFGQFSFRVRPYGIWESENHFLKTVPLHIFLFSMCAMTWKRLTVFREHQCWQYSISHSCFPTWLANPSLYWTSPRRTSSHPCCEEGLPQFPFWTGVSPPPYFFHHFLPPWYLSKSFLNWWNTLPFPIFTDVFPSMSIFWHGRRCKFCYE